MIEQYGLTIMHNPGQGKPREWVECTSYERKSDAKDRAAFHRSFGHHVTIDLVIYHNDRTTEFRGIINL